MHFYLFNHSSNRSLIGITNEPFDSKLPSIGQQGKWTRREVDDFEDDGEARLGFSLEDIKNVKADIERQGYHLAGLVLSYSSI